MEMDAQRYSVDLHNFAMITVGVISDTHGLVRPWISEVFRGVQHILHAGDIGKAEVLDDLRRIAPVSPVRGNNDIGSWAVHIPVTEVVEIGGVTIYLLHDANELDLNPAAAGFHVVVSGHSHRPKIENHKGVLYLNPGSAGPKRFTLPITVARMQIEGTDVRAEIVNLTH